MGMLPITIVVPTINAEAHMDELLDTVLPYFEDVIVVDSFSYDKTVDICLKRGVKIVQRPFVTSSDQFGWMLTKMPISTEWIMLLSQDERVTPELREAMARQIAGGTSHNGFTVRWRLWFMGAPLHAAPAIPRVFRKGHVGVTQVTCNEHFEITDGTMGALDANIEHKDTPTLWDWYEKQNLYTTREAIGIVQGNARTEKPKLFGNCNERRHWFAQHLPGLPFGLGYAMMFFGYYLRYGAWKDGWTGYYWTKCRVWVQWVTFFKVKEIRRTGVIPKMPEPRRGTYDPRIMQSDLQKQWLPEVVAAWEASKK